LVGAPAAIHDVLDVHALAETWVPGVACGNVEQEVRQASHVTAHPADGGLGGWKAGGGDWVALPAVDPGPAACTADRVGGGFVVPDFQVMGVDAIETECAVDQAHLRS